MRLTIAVSAVAIAAIGVSCSAAALAQAIEAEETATVETTTAAADLRAVFREACGADVETFCSAAQTKSERLACVAIHKDEFSDSCRAFFALHLPSAGQ